MPPSVEVVITIDGPAGTGKSTVSRLLAGRLGLDFLDTGAMYRAATAVVLDTGLAVETTRRADLSRDEMRELAERIAQADIHFDWSTDPPAVMILAPDGGYTAIDERIRDADVTRLVSTISAIGSVRDHLVRKQRVIFHQHPRLVTEGRDQGSVVFPDADVKFYLDASPEVRTRRRVEQLEAVGREVSYDEIFNQIAERDHIDSTREDGPLICPDDAQVIDTSDMPLDRVLEELERRSREQIASKLGRTP